jgi:hypothetical protein
MHVYDVRKYLKDQHFMLSTILLWMSHDFARYDYVVGFQLVGIFHVLFVAQVGKLDIQIVLNV